VATNDTTQYPGARLVAGIASFTEFSIQTAGTPYVPKVDVQFDGTTATIEVTGERGLTYDLYSSENLIDWNYLTTVFLYDQPNGFLSSAIFEDGFNAGLPRNFYQLEEPGGN
jgi:hypothetical protein